MRCSKRGRKVGGDEGKEGRGWGEGVRKGGREGGWEEGMGGGGREGSDTTHPLGKTVTAEYSPA